MRILMVAPEPFFQPRGTPFSVFHRARALGKLGHTVDLVTYPIGEEVTLPSVRVVRAAGIPFIRRVKIGPSLAKLPLDAMLFLRTVSLLARNRYDCIHTHEEAGLFGALLGRLLRLPHVYDMHSDLAQQMTNFRFTRSRLLIGLMRRVERTIVRSARVVIVICPELGETVEALAPGKPTVLIENTAVAADEAETAGDAAALAQQVAALRHELALPAGGGPVLVYTGTFEAYQGLDLLVAAVPGVLKQCPRARFVLAGGTPEQIAEQQRQAGLLGVEDALRFAGQRAPGEMPAFMALADVLLSPRSQGTNTPLKVYSYLHAGKPIVATRIRSHTQVLTDETALLVDPTAAALAAGIASVLADEALRFRLAQAARAVARRDYSYEAYLSGTAQTYALLAEPVAVGSEAV